MVESVGIDIVEVARIERLIAKDGDRFYKRVLGPEELAICESRVDKAQFVAGRFACKEAVVKALGVYLEDKPALSSLQIVHDEGKAPVLVLPDDVKAKLTGRVWHISISHERSYAAAVAVFSKQ